MTVRLSPRQRKVLAAVNAACEPVQLRHGEPDRVVPLYIDHVPELFFSEREREKFLENLESRGLVRIDRRYFIYATDKGRKFLAT